MPFDLFRGFISDKECKELDARTAEADRRKERPVRVERTGEELYDGPIWS